METEIIHQDEKQVVIQWQGPTGFGRLVVTYDDRGNYFCDAEYIGMKTLFEIIANTKLK